MIVRTETIDSRIETWLDENQPDKIVVIVSQTSKLLCLPKLQIHLKLDNIIYEVPDGDDSKTMGYCQDLWEVMLRNDVSRNSLVIAVGGGAVLDFAGFCASVYMRGIPCMYVPTTLLSMVDGSEGGKTGINFYGTKNIIGTFTEPVKILRNVDFLPSLPQFEVLAGWAEIIKHAVINNGALWNHIQNGIPALNNTELWMDIIRENITFKKSIVENDFREKGERKLLNLGHTIGHGLEALHFENPEITHGICVANGIYWETMFAVDSGFADPSLLETIEKLILPLYPKISWTSDEVEPLVSLLMHDKKNRNGKIQFTLPLSIGNCKYDVEISDANLRYFLNKHASAESENESSTISAAEF
jgi:3-dehydroquinate synthase